MKQIRIVFLLLIGLAVSSCLQLILDPEYVYIASPFDSKAPECEEDSQLGFYYGNTMFANRRQNDSYVRAIHDTTHNETWISSLDLVARKDAKSSTPSLVWRLVLKYKDGSCDAELRSVRYEQDPANPNAYRERLRTHEVTSCQIEFDSTMEDYTNSKGNYVGKYFSGDFHLTFIDADTGEELSFTGGRFKIITNKVGDNMIQQHEDDDFFHLN